MSYKSIELARDIVKKVYERAIAQEQLEISFSKFNQNILEALKFSINNDATTVVSDLFKGKFKKELA